jgi:hypothetical protein
MYCALTGSNPFGRANIDATLDKLRTTTTRTTSACDPKQSPIPNRRRGGSAGFSHYLYTPRSMQICRSLAAWHVLCVAAEGVEVNVRNNKAAVFGRGAVIGTLGGLIGRGGAEFRLPLLIGAFHFAALEAVIVNKATSVVVVASALPFRATPVPLGDIAAHWPIILNLLAGSILGAWLGAGWATRLRSATLYRVVALLLVGIAALLLLGHDQHAAGQNIRSR